MGSISAGTVNAYFGAETEAFQAGLQRVQAGLSSMGRKHDEMGNLIDGVMGRVGAGYDTMGKRAASAQMHIATGFGELAASMQGNGINIVGILQTIAYHAGSFELAIAAAAAVATMKIVGMLYELSGIKEAIATAGSQLNEVAAGVMIDSNVFGGVNERFETLKDQAAHVTEQLRQQVPAWVANAKESTETAKALQAYVNSLLPLHQKNTDFLNDVTVATAALEKQRGVVADLYNAGTSKNIQLALDLEQEKSHAALVEADNKMLADNAAAVRAVAAAHQNEQIPALVKVQIALAAGQQAMKNLGDETIKAYGILTQTGAADALEGMEGKFRAVAIAGADSGQVMARMGPDILKAVDAANKMGVAVPPMMQNIADAVSSGNDVWLGDLMAGLRKTPEAAKESAAASAKYLDEMGTRLEGSIHGGLDKGSRTGADAMKQHVGDAISDLTTHPIRLSFDIPDLRQAVLDAIRGAIPNTSGSNR